MFQEMSHVGIVVEDLDRSIEHWNKTFGWVCVERLQVELEAPLRSAFLSAGKPRGQTFCVELMEPLDKSDMNNAIARRLARHGEGVYHLAIHTDNPDTAAERLRAKGLTVYDAPAAFEPEPVRTIVHPKHANGVLLELI